MYVHNMVSGILQQWIEKEKKYMHFQQKHTQNMGHARQQLTS